MSHVYAILSIAGWSWALVVGVFLFCKLRGSGARTVEDHEKRT